MRRGVGGMYEGGEGGGQGMMEDDW